MTLPEDMLVSISGRSRVPPGFRFHPTEEELLEYYLKKRIVSDPIDLDVIPQIDLNKLEPWDIQEKCKIGSTSQNEWYFYSHKDKKYPTGTRTNRATTAGFWKATGRDKAIYACSVKIGMRKTLVFYNGRAPHGRKSEWVMHEYRLTSEKFDSKVSEGNEEGWVVCRVYKKKDIHKIVAAKSPLSKTNNNSYNSNDSNSDNFVNVEEANIDEWPTPSSEEGTLEQIIRYMGKTVKDGDGSTQVQHGEFFNGTYMKLPAMVEMPNSENNSVYESNNWEAFDGFIDSHGSTLQAQMLPSFGDPNIVNFNCTSHVWS